MGEFAEVYGEGMACSLVHEHDAATCAAPSVAELTGEMVCEQLRDIVARIDGSFEEAAEGRMDLHYALEQARDRLADLVTLAYGYDVLEPILGSEDGCAACGAHWQWTPWASDADRSGRRHQHASECPEGGQQ